MSYKSTFWKKKNMLVICCCFAAMAPFIKFKSFSISLSPVCSIMQKFVSESDVFPVLVPFGWGQNPDDESEYDQARIEVSDRATLKGSLAAVNPLVASSSTSMTSSSSEPAPAVMEAGFTSKYSSAAAVK